MKIDVEVSGGVMQFKQMPDGFKDGAELTQTELRKLLTYCSDTGMFVWNVDANSEVLNGDTAGTFDKDGYTIIRINNKSYKAHRLVWLYEYGTFPKNHIDHINHNPSDNRLDNLREANIADNMKNKKKYRNNKSGINGVGWNASVQKWVAYITVQKKRIHLGSFAIFEDAVNARKESEILHGFHKNHGVSYVN